MSVLSLLKELSYLDPIKDTDKEYIEFYNKDHIEEIPYSKNPTEQDFEKILEHPLSSYSYRNRYYQGIKIGIVNNDVYIWPYNIDYTLMERQLGVMFKCKLIYSGADNYLTEFVKEIESLNEQEIISLIEVLSKRLSFIDADHINDYYRIDTTVIDFNEYLGHNVTNKRYNFESYYISEMPHGEFEGVPIDFKIEKSGWNKNLISLIDSVDGNLLDSLLEPFYRLNFGKIFKKQFDKLSEEEQQDLLDVLPDYFILDMNLLEKEDIQESAKYSDIDFTPPQSVAKQAEKGLEYRKKAKGKGGLSVSQAKKEGVGSGVQRAVNLKNRDTISPQTIKRMKAFFDRHEKNASIDSKYKGEPWKDRGYVAWLLWGGDAGRSWANKIVKQMESRDKK